MPQSLYPSDIEIIIGEDPPRQLLEEPDGWTSSIEFLNHPVTDAPVKDKPVGGGKDG